jgi:hypothetical protein
MLNILGQLNILMLATVIRMMSNTTQCLLRFPLIQHW